MRELEEKLKRSEDQRQKLKDNLAGICLCKPNDASCSIISSGTTTVDPHHGLPSIMTTMTVELQKFFKEKATNTQELLRQHVQLQGDADKKEKELSELRMARQGLQSQLEAIQATSEAAASAPLPRYASCAAPGLLLDAQECQCWPGVQAARC